MRCERGTRPLHAKAGTRRQRAQLHGQTSARPERCPVGERRDKPGETGVSSDSVAAKGGDELAWVRIHDGAMRHPKILALSDSAFRLWVKGLSYCQLNLTDGLIPRTALREMGAKRKDVEALSLPLSAEYAPLWEPHPVGFKAHDYLFWNDSREKVQDRQAKSRIRLDNWKKKQEEYAVQNGARNGVQNGVQNAALTKPNQTKPNLEDREDQERAFERFWVAYPKHSGRQDALRWWLTLGPNAALVERILAGVTAYKAHVGDWKPQFIKAPLKWLEGAHWEDEFQASPENARKSYEFTCPHTPPCVGRNECDVKQRIALARA